jgi:nucleoid DNA-binding protein
LLLHNYPGSEIISMTKVDVVELIVETIGFPAKDVKIVIERFLEELNN